MRKHSFPPRVAASCRLLVLGSLPGEESLRRAQYYAHPRNAFWPIMGELCGFDPGLPYEERLARLNASGIALWDVVASCHRQGSLDQHIEEEVPNDIPGLLDDCPSIRALACNGTASHRYLKKYFPGLWERPGLHICQLTSTSPAAARLTLAQKCALWRAALAPFLDAGGGSPGEGGSR